jgi:hypothetical protein
MKKKLLHSLGPVIVLLLLASAFWILHHELRQYQYSDIKQALAEIPSAEPRDLVGHGLPPIPPFDKGGSGGIYREGTAYPKRSPEHALAKPEISAESG